MTTGIFAVLAAALGALGAYLAAARKLSGKINTSEASSLWQEASNLRNEYKEDIRRLEKRLDDVTEANDHLRSKNAELEREVRAHERTISDLRREVEKWKVRVKELEAVNGI